jgi:hypothetical protein
MKPQKLDSLKLQGFEVSKFCGFIDSNFLEIEVFMNQGFEKSIFGTLRTLRFQDCEVSGT